MGNKNKVEIMENKNKNDRRDFLRTAGAALVAAAIPAAVAVQNAEAQIGGLNNNLRQIALASHPVAPNPNLPGVFGMASFQLQLFADIGADGYATLSDPVFPDINSHIRVNSAAQTSNNTYLWRGTVERSQSGELLGKQVVVRSRVLDADGNCNVSLTVEDTPLAIGLLLPAVQKVREKA